MNDLKVSEEGLFAAVALTVVATAGHFLTGVREFHRFDWLWIGIFGIAFCTLCGAAVNFDLKRWKA